MSMSMEVLPKTIKRPAIERGEANHGWLRARHTFSFGSYYDPQQMGFRTLRVINDDVVAPGKGFGTHPHSNMEIFTYVKSGKLEHKDSMGNGAIIRPGNLQYMSAGSGVTHSEFNPSATENTELYQIWLQPNVVDGEPRYAEKRLADLAAKNTLTLLYSGDGRESSTQIRQNAALYFGRVDEGNSVSLSAVSQLPHAWIQVISGSLSVAGEDLEVSDGLGIESITEELEIMASADAEFLLFHLN